MFYGVLMRVVKTITSMLSLTCTRESYLKIHLPKKYDYDSETKCLNVLIDTRIKKKRVCCQMLNVYGIVLARKRLFIITFEIPDSKIKGIML